MIKLLTILKEIRAFSGNFPNLEKLKYYRFYDEENKKWVKAYYIGENDKNQYEFWEEYEDSSEVTHWHFDKKELLTLWRHSLFKEI